jgi:hypothetical protein
MHAVDGASGAGVPVPTALTTTEPETAGAAAGTAPAPRPGPVDSREAGPVSEPRRTGQAPVGAIPQTAAQGAAEGGWGDATLDKAFEQMDSLEKKIGELDPEKPGDQKELMQIQLKLQRIQQVVSLINEIRKTRHDMAMSVIRNIG